MTRYAADTSVSCESSRAQIERTLTRYGATSFMYGMRQDGATVAFEMKSRQVMFRLPLPDRNSKEFSTTPGGRRRRDHDSALKAWEQACRQRWRALSLAILAKLEAVECGIATFDEEFLAHLVLPGTHGQTVGEYAIPRLEEAYQTKKLPPLLPGP